MTEQPVTEGRDEPEDATEQVRTGVPRVDAVIEDVADLEGRPVDEHAGVYESAHDELRRTLDDPDADVADAADDHPA